MADTPEAERPRHFIEEIIERDIAAGLDDGRVHTRFPPEPNGHLHIGHAKSICLNFGLAARYGGKCNLRFDDTNPEKESSEYEESIVEDVRWLGFDWEDRLFHASDYFDRLYQIAEALIEAGHAYVDSQSPDDIRAQRGTLTEPGVDSPFRDRAAAESLDLFRRMRAGEFADGTHVLRARIDMASPNINMRDPVLYRIRRHHHHRTGDSWPIYPMYDFTHALSDALEGITHSICTLEFEDHRPLYDWCVEHADVPSRPHQYEFARLEMTYTLTSKRKLLALVGSGQVSGWDDPRMPTLKGMRRRGYPPAAMRLFAERIGVTKKNAIIDFEVLENAVREVLDHEAPRRMAVLDPLPLIIENYPEGQEEWLPAANHPKRPELGERQIPFSGTVFIERDDFMVDPPKKFHRLGPGRMVRLRYGYIVTCTGFDTDEAGNVVAVRCTYDPATRSGEAPEGVKVKGTIHFVSAAHARAAEVRLYERLFEHAAPGAQSEPLEHLNPDSLRLVTAQVEPSLADAAPESVFQFERTGYFCADRVEHGADRLVFNRTATLRDTWQRVKAEG